MITLEFTAAWFVSRVAHDERGANLVEYGLLVALIALVCALAVGFIGKTTSNKFSKVGSGLS